MLTSKELYQIAKETPGWNVDTTANGFYKLTPPQGEIIILAPNAEGRDAKNNLARCKRAGLPVPDRKNTGVKRNPKVSYKVCSRCHRRLGSWEFYTASKTVDGLQAECVSCTKERNLIAEGKLSPVGALSHMGGGGAGGGIEIVSYNVTGEGGTFTGNSGAAGADENTLDAALTEALRNDEEEPILVELDLEQVAESIPLALEASAEVESLRTDLDELTDLWGDMLGAIDKLWDAIKEIRAELAVVKTSEGLTTRVEALETQVQRIEQRPLQRIAARLQREE